MEANKNHWDGLLLSTQMIDNKLRTMKKNTFFLRKKTRKPYMPNNDKKWVKIWSLTQNLGV